MKNKLKIKTKLRNRGRNVDLKIKESLKSLINISNYRRDHLIEYLHIIQDNLGYIDNEHMRALADLLDISQTEVYEVATFYHHFDVVKNNNEKPPVLTIRVCDSLSCEINGAQQLYENLEQYHSRLRQALAGFVQI